MSSPPKRTSRRDFSSRTAFPGTEGNRFDTLLRGADYVQATPAPVFALLLLALAALPGLARGSWLVAADMGLFLLGDWALLAALPRWGRSFGPPRPTTLLLAFMRLPFALLPLPYALAAQLMGTALVVYGFWIEPQRLGVTRQALPMPKLRSSRPLRLLHLGDLHAEIGFTGREQLLIERVRACQPDLILFSGDFINLSYLNDQRAWEVARRVLRELDAPLGVFAVSGSPAVDQPDIVAQVLAGLTHVRWLRDEKITLEHDGQSFDLIGLHCTHKPFVDGPRLETLLGADPRERFTVLLYHTPDLAPEAADAGVDLQVSGHTHGGQVRLPLIGALYAASLYGKRFEMGRRQVDGLTLYITRGIGLEGKAAPRVRLLCPPEIVLWEIGASVPPQ
jgi:predicted MPP superfamily phosphohydrolase